MKLNLLIGEKKSNIVAAFTLVELVIVAAIIAILAAVTTPAFRYFQQKSDLNNSAQDLISALRLAQNKTAASQGQSQWGVYFSTSTSPNQYTLFKGANYASRDTQFDEPRKLAAAVEIYQIDLGGLSEVVFNKITGAAVSPGSLSVGLKIDFAQNKIIYIDALGQAGFTAPPAISDASRIKDSRHVHFDYNRTISTPSENLILTFDGTTQQTLAIASNLKDGQIYWEGEVNVGGDIQKIKITTHKLNNPDTQFSVHRDRRYNNKSLKIELSGDISGSLLEYSANGLITTKTSIYAASSIWQ